MCSPYVLSMVLFFSTLPLAVVAQGPEEVRSPAALELHALFDAEWDYEMQRNPTRASTLGDRRWNDRWPDLSTAALQSNYEHEVGVLSRLGSIDRKQLGPSDQLNYDLFKKRYEDLTAAYKYRLYLLPVNQREGIQAADELASSLRFESVKDYDDWLARLRSFPAHMEQTIALMREGIRARMLWPKVVMQRVPAQIDKQIVDDPKASLFYKPFRNFGAAIPPQDRERLERDAQTAISNSVVPAYRQFKRFFVDEYLAASSDRVGIWQWPQGDEIYAFLARRETTTGMSPREIHELGLREVARIRAEMLAIMDRVGFKGSLQEFFRFLRTDPRFYYETPAELFEAYQAMAKTIDPRLVKVFKTLPRMPYGVEPIPDAIAPDTTTAYYRQPAADGSRAGTYFVNLYKPESRPKYEMMALSLHESVPGHHLQIALAYEQGGIPRFRRYGGYTAFIEGWGLYAESLGDEMGLYGDPYSKFGQLTYEMWRAVRLVVDTGMHFLKWDRQRAIDFFLENAAKQELDVVNEIDRYISDPGQALAYKIGQLKIRELRERARRELGAAFDVRDFHDAVLLNGALPLDVLERNIDVWIAAKKRTAAARSGSVPSR